MVGDRAGMWNRPHLAVRAVVEPSPTGPPSGRARARESGRPPTRPAETDERRWPDDRPQVPGAPGRHIASELVFLTRALKAPTVREAVPRRRRPDPARPFTPESHVQLASR